MVRIPESSFARVLYQLDPPPPPPHPPPPPKPPNPPPPPPPPPQPPPNPPPPQPPPNPPPPNPPRPKPPVGMMIGKQPGPPHPLRPRRALLRNEITTNRMIRYAIGGIPPPVLGKLTSGSCAAAGGGVNEVSSWKLNSLAKRCAVRSVTSSRPVL